MTEPMIKILMGRGHDSVAYREELIWWKFFRVTEQTEQQVIQYHENTRLKRVWKSQGAMNVKANCQNLF